MDKIVLLAELKVLRDKLEAAARERDALEEDFEQFRVESGDRIAALQEVIAGLKAGGADAAALRRAFDRACAEYPAGFTLPEPVRQWWARFYEAIRDHTAGLALIAEVAELRAALEPFARAARGVPENWLGDKHLTWEYVPAYPNRNDTRIIGLPPGTPTTAPTIDQWRTLERLARRDGSE